MPSKITSYIGFAPKISLTIYPNETPSITGISRVNCHVSSTTIIIAVIGAFTIDAKNVAIHIITMQSAYIESMPITPQSFDTKAPIHAPIDSIGMNIPHGTPAPRFNTVALARNNRIIIKDTTIGDEKTVVTSCASTPPFVPRDWMNEDANYVTDKFIDYIEPLIQGDYPPFMVNGLPQHLVLKR